MFGKTVLFLLAFLTLSAHSHPSLLLASPRETPVVQVVKEWSPSVVNISTERIVFLRHQPFWKGYGDLLDSLFEDYFKQSTISAVKLPSIGSGAIVRDEGVIVTNAHVVNMASRIYIIFKNGDKAEGKVILVNQQDDLAFIKIDPPYPLKSIPLADPEDLMIGETAIAIGNSYGLENSVSVGVISGKNRMFILPNRHVFTDLVQTDASINLGSSGGALLNLNGELVGINLAVVQSAQNIGFAISPKKISPGLSYYDFKKKNQGEKTTPVPVP